MNQSTLIDESIHECIYREPTHQELDDRPLGLLDLGCTGGEPPVDPAGEDLLQRAVEDPGGEAGVEIRAQLAPFLAAGDDPLERCERVLDLIHLAPELRAAGNLTDEHAHEVGIGLPGTE